MKIAYQQVVQNVANIANRTNYTADFLYELLAAYGRSASSITRLKQGDLNLSNKDDTVLQKDVVYFKVFPANTILEDEIEDLEDDPLTERYKPRYLIATDLEDIRAKDTKKGTTLALKITDVDKDIAFFYGWTGDEITDEKTEAIADRWAADKMNQLYAEIEKTNLAKFAKDGSTFRHDLNVFFTRLLFCFFAEDTGLFNKNQFADAIKLVTNTDGSDLNVFFTYLFKALDSKDKSSFSTPYSDFPYVNGTIFDTAKHGIVIPDFSAQARHLLLECTKSNWSEINPDIFGTMFQGIVDPDKRDHNGMDYTSVPNIMKVIEPLFLDELRERFDAVYNTPDSLRELLTRIRDIKIFDPACGSGNFLIIAYKQLRLLENAILERLVELKIGRRDKRKDFSSVMFDMNSITDTKELIKIYGSSEIELSNFYGIEIDDFAHEMAILSLYIAKHQMDAEFEKQFLIKLKHLPLIENKTIVKGNAARLNWHFVCNNNGQDEIYLIGNPPYKGARKQTTDQKQDLKDLFSGRFSRYKDLDYISIWFYKGAEYIEGTRAELAFVSTNSITQGDQVGMLWPHIFNKNLEIGFAYTSFKWQNSARDQAGVTVVIISLRNINQTKKKVYTGEVVSNVKNINAYLTASDANTVVYGTRKNINTDLPEMPKGNMPYDGGNLILSETEKDELLREYPNARKFVRKFVNAKSFINDVKQFCLWIHTTDLDEANTIPPIKDRIAAVREMRLASSDKAANKLAGRAHEFRETNEPSSKSLLVPSTSSENRIYAPMAYLDNDTIASNASFVVYDAPLWLFALLESKMHMAWIRTVCGKLKTDYRYSSTLGYNTFPASPLSDAQKDKLNTSARKILATRAGHFEKTLAEMYDPDKMPADLREAHDANDIIVDQLYRQRGFVNDEERLATLFDLYEQMAKQNSKK